MNKVSFVNSISKSFHKTGLMLRKHSPEILLVAGVVGTVASAVMACKATTKVNTILEGAKTEIDKVNYCTEHAKEFKDGYSDEDRQKDLAIVYAQTGVQLVKLYAPSVILGALSITSILASNNILRKRNVALAAAYATVDKGFKEYRSRVVERFGKELDRELRYDIKAKEIEETVTDEDGNETVVKKTVSTATIGSDDYARVYDDGCLGWTKDPEANKTFLLMQQSFANKKLQSQGYLFLNDVYEMLGFPKSKAGQVVGWVLDEEHPSGDNYVDFGIFNDIDNERKRAFINGKERNIILDFNVDGPVLDMVRWRDGL